MDLLTNFAFTACALVGAVSLSLYLVPLILYTFILPEQNLKKKYKADWDLVLESMDCGRQSCAVVLRIAEASAFVTGGSSGVGAELTRKLASQGINVVIAALDDKIFDGFYAQITKEFPKIRFVPCRVDLSQGDYLSVIKAATADLSINIVCNNAGYITPGMFVDLSLERNLRNYETNATSAIKITHHFANLMLKRQTRGLITFTSSSAAFLPNPLAAIYSSSKAFLSSFGASVAAELRPFGIDVLVIHPSPIASRFVDGAKGFAAAQAAMRFAAPPSVIADAMCRSAGRFVMYDQGLAAALMKIFLVKVIDGNFLAELMSRFARLTGDWQNFNKSRLKKQ